MNFIKKHLATVLALALIVSTLSGCAGTKIPTSSEAEGSSEGAKSENITLKFFSNESVMDDKFKLINDEYTKRNPNVNIEVIQVPGADYYTKVDTAILSGEQLDVCYWNIKFDYVPRASKGEFYPMDEFIAEENTTITDLYTIDPTCEDGKVYALPGDVKEWLVWINKSDLEKAELKVPDSNWTWDDFREYAKKMTWGEGANKHYGSLFFNWDHYNVLTCYNRLDGNPYFDKEGKLNFDDPSFVESLKLRYEMEQVDKTQLPLSEILAMEMDYRAAFLGERCSMLVMASNIIPQISETDKYPHDFVTTFAPLPKPVGGRESYTYADNRFYCIGKTTVNAKETYKYLRYFTTEGIPMKNVTFTADKAQTVDMKTMLGNMTSEKPELFDIDALTSVLTNPKRVQNFWTYVPTYTSEIVNMYKAEAEKAVMGEISPEKAIENAKVQGASILKKYE